LDVALVEKIKNEGKSLKEYSNAQHITNEDLLLLKCDILVPAALENQITKENAEHIDTKLVLELANGPTTPDADGILQKRAIPLLPDILANAGGVTVSYFEQVQNNMNYYREKEEVNNKLFAIMTNATDGVLNTAKKHNITYRDAAYVVALERLLAAMKIRGW